MMEQSTIYTTGHGNKTMDAFVEELRTFGISYLLDIRSKPYSKWNPAFNKDTLSEELRQREITYVYVGDALGGMPEDRSCYDQDGKVNYDRLKEKDFFREGLQRLHSASEKQVRLAIMCSEAKPHECHRSKLIGQELLKKGISLNHIVGPGKTKSQETVMAELTKGMGTKDLFGKETGFRSRKEH